MALVIDDLQNNRLYRKNIYLPTSVGNKKKHSAIFLMTPNYTSSISTMNYPFFINNNRYESYYTEKDISFVLTEDHRLVENSDDIPTEIQSGLLKCTMITCNTIEEFKQYSIPERIYNVGPVEQLTAYVFINTEDDMLEGYAMVQGTERILIIETISAQLRSDILEFLMITYPISTAVTRTERDRLLYSSYGFEDNINNNGVMVLKTPVHESVSLTKMDMEIAIWEAQIKITQTIIKNFNNDNWMSHMYRSLKRKILKIPLKGYTDKIDDTVDSWENLLKDQKATLDFYLSVKAIESKEVFDMSDIVDEYTDWVNKLTCPKSLKIKIINTVIDSYKKNIKDYQYNLDRYRKLDEASKRVENVKALVSKTFSTWGFITTGPLSIVKSAMMKSILPKSQKKNVLSEAELEAKIELYTKIVENLEEKKKEIQSLEEISLIYDINSLAESYNISFTVITENKKYKRSSGESKDLAKARQFVYDVKMLAAKRNLPVFVVTNGASGISNNGCEAVKHARDSHIEWEKSHNEDPNEDWSDKMKHESVILETSNKTPEETVLTENYIFSKDNLYINFDKFESGKTNVCFVTGLSGSGKSTLAGTLATKYKAEWIELDIFEHCSEFTDSQLKEAGEVFYDYLSSHKDLWDRLKKKEVKGDELNKEIAAFFKYAISWAHRHKSQKFIFEGVQIYSFGDKSFMKSQPIVFVNASMLKSIIQRFKRNGNGKVDLWAELKNEFPQMLSWYIGNERDFTKFKKAVLNESSKGKYYYVSAANDMDDEALFYSENGMGIYDSIENAIASYPHKAYKLFVFDTDMAIKTEVLSNGKVKYDGSAGLNLIGSINVTYNRDGSFRSYDWNNKIKDGISVKESTMPESVIIKDYVVPYIKEEASLTNLGLQTEDSITFLEGNNEVLVEADAAYNAVLRRILYSERIKNHKEIMLVYDQLKEDCPWIRFTYINYEKYMGRNLFIDWSYYTKSFFKNNIMRYDKAVNLYFDFVTRFLQDHRLTEAGYAKKSVIVPINDWVKDVEGRYWDYKTDLNPISVIYRLANTNLDKLKETWGDYKFIFTGTNGYFVLDFSKFDSKDLAKFLQNVKVIVKKEPIVDNETPDNSTKGIVNSVIDKLENNSNGSIQINNLTGAEKASEEELKDRIDQSMMSSEDDDKDNEEKLVDAITKAASKASNDDEVIAKIDNDDYIKQLVLDLKTSSPDSVQLEPTRVARVRKNTDNFRQKIVAGKSVSELLTDFNEQPLPETKIPIDSINEDWQHMTYINHNKTYNLDGDIVRCLNHFSNTTIPVSILDTTVEDKSTSEDWIYTWTVKCEDVYGKRFTLRFDIPKLVNNRTMHLRGNDKTINGQLMNLPILKTEENTCQMTSNYNKIFFSGYGTSTGKSYVIADRIIKTLNKIETSKDLMIELGDNTRISSKYDLPTDYIDISSVVSKVSFIGADKQTRVTLFFNQDEFIEKYSSLIKKKDELAYGIMEFPGGKTPTIIYYNSAHPISEDILGWLSQNAKFDEVYNTTSVSTRYTYSKASILSTDIPIAVMIGYYIGLIPMLDRANISYTVSDKRPKYDKNRQDLIRLSDAYIVYDLNYDSSMLLNGLKECDTAAYSLKDVNTKRMWVEFLDLFGGRLKADGLDMFYDLMIDPISLIVCEKYKLPTDYIDALLYANALLSDNKFNKHTDITGNRYRTNEIIAGYTYKALCNSYTQYRRDLRSSRDAKMTMKQSAVLDLLFADNTFGDLSSLSDLLEWESISSTSFKGLSGMNSDRAYGLDKRTFDQSMVNLLALSTGFSANTGVTRQSTIDMDIDTARGYVKNSSDDKMSITKTFCMSEALTPYGTTSDDPFRSAMTFIQTSKHGMRTKISDPLLVTNGADQALPYMTSNTFTYKTKNAGKVKEKTDDYMVLEYKDGSTEVVDLREKILKNSDGGMYIAVKLDTDLKVGNVFSSNEIVARDKISYSDNIGPTDHYSYNIGTFVKFAIINSDEGFEDSCIQTEWMANALSSVVVLDKEYTLPKDTTVHFMAKKGQKVQEGEPILIFQNSFDEEDANMLIKTLSDESGDDIISELGRIPIYSKVTGVIKDIKITRTVEIDELSPSLKKIVNDYEREVKKFNSVLDKYDPEKAKIADATYKLEPTGKLKNAANSVKIEFSLAYDDKFGVGDKVVCYSALKGVSKGKIAVGQEPYSQYRKDEKIHYIQSTTGDMKRMVGSINKIGALNKVMVELARQSCDIMGIKWKYFDEWDN